MMPGNPVVGSTILRRPAIQSPNYAAGSAGWTINSDGSAEFNNLTIRGTFDGTDFEINTDGAFFYNGTPANGNLMIAIASAGGTDAHGNTYAKGITAGQASDTSQVKILPSPSGAGTASEVQMPINAVSMSNQPNFSAGQVSGSLMDFVLSGPGIAGTPHRDWIQLILFSNDGAGTPARGELRYISDAGGVTTELSWDSSGVTIGTLAVTSLTVNGSSNTGNAGLTDGTINGSSQQVGLPNGTITGTSGGASAGTAHTHGGGSYSVTNGQHTHGPGSYAVANGSHNHAL